MAVFDPTKEDYRKYFNEKGDPGFSPERNKKVIENTIKKHNKNRRRKINDWLDAMGERSHAVASYLKSNAVDSSKPIEKYLGKRNLAYLRGEDIVNSIKALNPTITKQDIVNASKRQKRTVKTQG